MSNQICGIVMPISPMEDCDAQHWIDVKDIISDAILSVGYEPQLVSTAAEVNIIQARIIQNLYQNPIVVCDVSCKNANVMFELGLRLAFDKPTIVIKDDKTGYSFDTSPIEHLTYPRSLRHGAINKFKDELANKIRATVAAKDRDPNFSPFLKSFGPFKAASIETKEVPAQELMFDMLQSMMSKLERLSAKDEITRRDYNRIVNPSSISDLNAKLYSQQMFETVPLNLDEVIDIEAQLKKMFGSIVVDYEEDGENAFVIVKRDRLSQRDRSLIADIVRDVSKKRVKVTVEKVSPRKA